MTSRRGGFVVGAALTVALVLGGCQQAPPTDPGDRADASASTGATATAHPSQDGATATAPAERVEVSEEQVHDVLLAMDDALQAGDVEAYLEHVGPDLHQDQRAWFEGLLTAPLQVRELRLDGVVSRTGSEGTVAHVGLRHQFLGSDPVPVLQQYRWVFAATDGSPAVLVDSRGRNGDFFGHPQLWDLGAELVVLEGHSVTLLVQASRMAEAETLLDTLDLAAEETLATLPWVGQGRDRLVVQLAPAEVLEEHGWAESTGSPLLLRVSPVGLAREPGRLAGSRTPVHPHLFLDLDLALLDLEDYGRSPGGQTELRFVAAYAGTWGEDPDAWPEDWLLQGPASWWSSVEDPLYADHLLLGVGDHFAAVGAPTGLPVAPLDPLDLDAGDAYVLESVGLTYYLEQAHGRESLIDLVDRLIPLDQRYDPDEIELAYQEALGVGQEQLVDSFAAWTQTLPTGEDETGPPPRGR